MAYLNAIDPTKPHRSQPTSKPQPPPQMLAEIAAENTAYERERHRIVCAIKEHNDTQMMAQHFQEFCEPFIGSDWVENFTPAGQKPLHYRIVAFHWRIRPSLGDNPASTNRDQYLLVATVEPWHEVAISSAQERIARNTSGNAERAMWQTPAASLLQPVRDVLGPTEFKVLSKFLANFHPLAGFDVSPLEQLSAPDIGHEDESRPIPPAKPTLDDVIAKLAAALNVAPKTTTP